MELVIGVPVAILGTIPNITINIVDIITMIVAAVLLFLFSYKDTFASILIPCHSLRKEAFNFN